MTHAMSRQMTSLTEHDWALIRHNFPMTQKSLQWSSHWKHRSHVSCRLSPMGKAWVWENGICSMETSPKTMKITWQYFSYIVPYMVSSCRLLYKLLPISCKSFFLEKTWFVKYIISVIVKLTYQSWITHAHEFYKKIYKNQFCNSKVCHNCNKHKPSWPCWISDTCQKTKNPAH